MNIQNIIYNSGDAFLPDRVKKNTWNGLNWHIKKKHFIFLVCLSFI